MILITDGCTGIGEGSLGRTFAAASHTSLPRYGYRLHIACIADTKDPAFSRSEPLYQRLVAEAAVSGEVFIPEGSLCERAVQQMFLAICEKHYVPFTGTLRCGNLRCPVHVFPAPENYSRLVDMVLSWFCMTHPLIVQGSHASWKVLESSGVFGKIYRTWKVLEIWVKGPGKSWNFLEHGRSDVDTDEKIFMSAHL